MTFLKISWRNIGRNPRRSIIIILTISVGLWGMIATKALYDGMEKQMIANAVRTETGHIQIHRRGFHDRPLIKLNLENPDAIAAELAAQPHIQAFAPRIKTQGMISSPGYSSGVLLVGINPDAEINITDLHKYVEAGEYLKSGDNRGIIVGAPLAAKLHVEVGHKVVLMAQGMNGEIGSAAMRVRGIFHSASPEFDKFVVFISLNAAQKMLDLNDRISEFAIIVDHDENMTAVYHDLKKKLAGPDLEILNWQEIMPIIVQFIRLVDFWILICYVIVFVIVAVGIINILMMAIFERMREFGVMRALGTTPLQIAGLIITESFFLGIVGLVCGGIISYLSTFYFVKHGVNFGFLAEGMEFWGFSPIVYPIFTWENILMAAAAVFVTTILAALYPAYRAVRLKPVAALRFI